MILTIPRDLEARVAPLIGTPFMEKGDTPAGWDCRGHVNHCWRALLGVALPDYRDLYDASILRPFARSERSRLIAEGLKAWRPVEPQAGAVAWLEWMGSAGHVGFMLGARRLSHADVGVGTTLLDLDDAGAAYRLRGAFVPAWVEEIVHE